MYQMHIMQVLLMINLMVFEEKIEEYDLLIIIVMELFEIVLHQHKIQHNLMKYEIIIYNVPGVMHVPRLNLMLFEGNVNYDLKILRMNKPVRLLHMVAGEVWFDIKKEKEKEEQNNDSNNKQ